MTSLVPYVIEKNGRDERAMDIYSRLLRDRIILLGSAINDDVANSIVAQLLYLQFEDSKADIHMYINSPGGSVYAGLAIYDTMQMITSPVSTVAVGVTASMGTVLLAAGAAGRRYALPHATIHMHPASSGAQGYTEDVRIAFREQERVQTQLFQLVSKHSKRHWREIEHDFERDRWMNAMEAREYGLVDEVLGDTSNIVVLNRKSGELTLSDGTRLLDDVMPTGTSS